MRKSIPAISAAKKNKKKRNEVKRPPLLFVFGRQVVAEALVVLGLGADVAVEERHPGLSTKLPSRTTS